MFPKSRGNGSSPHRDRDLVWLASARRTDPDPKTNHLYSQGRAPPGRARIESERYSACCLRGPPVLPKEPGRPPMLTKTTKCPCEASNEDSVAPARVRGVCVCTTHELHRTHTPSRHVPQRFGKGNDAVHPISCAPSTQIGEAGPPVREHSAPPCVPRAPWAHVAVAEPLLIPKKKKRGNVCTPIYRPCFDHANRSRANNNKNEAAGSSNQSKVPKLSFVYFHPTNI